VLQFATALETVANAKGGERKAIEGAVQDSIKALTGMLWLFAFGVVFLEGVFCLFV
jgi:hypothetical protein